MTITGYSMYVYICNYPKLNKLEVYNLHKSLKLLLTIVKNYNSLMNYTLK